MLTLFRSNRAEFLVDVLGRQLQGNPPPPLQQVQVVVNTWPTSRWLGEQLALRLGGVVAHLRFPFPAAHLNGIVDRLLQDREAASADPWRASRLVWPLLDLLPRIAASPEGGPLRGWLAPERSATALDLATWQLGRAIADAFDDYALYRPELLAAWETGAAEDGYGAPLPEGQAWQMSLYRALRERLGCEPFALRAERAIARLRDDPRLPADLIDHLGGALRLFGLSSLAPLQVRLLQALSGSLPVDLYLLTPCADLWQRCRQRRQELRDALALRLPLEGEWLRQAPALEARFGRLGAEFQQLLEGTGEAQLGEMRENALFFSPAAVAEAEGLERAGEQADSEEDSDSEEAVECPRPAPLLCQLQEQLVAPELRPELTLAEGDHSLEFHPCPGPLRQVQIVRDRLLQLLAADDQLEPRDILVMTPQVEEVAPLLAAVFSDSEATGVSLPWRLTDRSQQAEAGLAHTLLCLLQLAGERLQATGLERLLSCRPLQQRFELEPAEIARLNRELQRLGFRWGLDADARGGDATHTLSWAMDRLLLSLVLPPTPGLALGTGRAVAPAEGRLPVELIGRWLHLLQRLRHWLRRLSRPREATAWAALLRDLVSDLFDEAGEAAAELPDLLAAIDEGLEAAAPFASGSAARFPARSDGGARVDGTHVDGDGHGHGEADADVDADGRGGAGAEPRSGAGADGATAPERALEVAVVTAVLQEALAADSGRFGHRSGALTISALEPMRAIPHKVIVLMGLDAASFPRQRLRPGFHLMARRRQLGDADPADQDRYILLEALLSARRHLLITWSCRDERTGEVLPPAPPVRHWLDWLQGSLGEAAARLTVAHPASPLDRHNFLPTSGRPPTSCDRRLLQARLALERDNLDPCRGLAFTAPPEPSPPVDAPMAPADPAAAAADPATRERGLPERPALEELRAWLMQPQQQWLERLGMRPREWQERLDDLEPLALGERDRSALLRHVIQRPQSEGPSADPGGAPPVLQPRDWLHRHRGQGLLPALAAGDLEAQSLTRRLDSLRSSLGDLGPPWSRTVQWQRWRACIEGWGDALVQVHPARESLAARLSLWLDLLLAAAAESPIRRGVLISRTKGDTFAISTALEAPEAAMAAAELERLAALRQQWLHRCWPVPPRTGWAWMTAEQAKPGSGAQKALEQWEGGYGIQPEREEATMVACFGPQLPLADLLQDPFALCATSLLQPLVAAIQAPPARGRTAGRS